MAASDEIVFSEGQMAFELGASAHVCPYPDGCRAAQFWHSGWDEARRYSERRHEREFIGKPLGATPILRLLPLFV